MKILKPAVSKDAPNLRNALWIKPVSGGFELYYLDNGRWQPLSTGSANSYTDSAIANVVGTNSDTSEDLTLYGLKAYVDSKTETPSTPVDNSES